MNVQDVMTGAPCSCRPTDALAVAARIMWESDCGAVPVVDDQHVVVGMVTDRDACMAAYTRGRRFDEIPVGSVMARKLVCCSPEDSLSEAERRMQEAQVRRLPVVDHGNKLVGVLSCNDLIRHAASLGDSSLRASRSARLVQVLSAIGNSRPAALPVAPETSATVETPTTATAGRQVDVIPAVAPAATRQPQTQSKPKGKKPKSKSR